MIDDHFEMNVMYTDFSGINNVLSDGNENGSRIDLKTKQCRVSIIIRMQISLKLVCNESVAACTNGLIVFKFQTKMYIINEGM